jgi:hypothetical protein
LNPAGLTAAGMAVYAAVVAIVNAVHHHGALPTPVIVAALGAIAAMYTRLVVTPVADRQRQADDRDRRARVAGRAGRRGGRAAATRRRRDPMTIEEARDHIGDLVTYRNSYDQTANGAITSVAGPFVFVRYGSDQFSRGTAAEALTLRPEGVTP